MEERKYSNYTKNQLIKEANQWRINYYNLQESSNIHYDKRLKLESTLDNITKYLKESINSNKKALQDRFIIIGTKKHPLKCYDDDYLKDRIENFEEILEEIQKEIKE